MDIATEKFSEWQNCIENAEKAQTSGKYELAEANLSLALEEAQEFGSNDRRLAYTLEKLSECMWFQHRLEEAGDYARQALEEYERVLGRDDKDVGSIAGNLAMIYHLQGKSPEAEKTYRRALKIKTASLGAKHPDVQKLLGSFADLLQSLGRNDEAEQLRTKASMVTKKQWTNTGTFKSVAPTDTRKNLEQPSTPSPPPSNSAASGSVSDTDWQSYKEQAEKAAREGDLLESLRLWLFSLGPARAAGKNNPNYCYSLDSIGDLSMRLEKYRDAEKCFQDSYDIKSKALGKEHMAVARSAGNLARLYYSMCDYSKAEKYASQSVTILQKAQSGESQELACALHNLATLFHVQRKYEHAETHYQRALKMKQKVFGQDHPETTRLLKSYADLLKCTHREEQAKHMDECADGIITGSWKQVEATELRVHGGWNQSLTGE